MKVSSRDPSDRKPPWLNRPQRSHFPKPTLAIFLRSHCDPIAIQPNRNGELSLDSQFIVQQGQSSLHLHPPIQWAVQPAHTPLAAPLAARTHLISRQRRPDPTINCLKLTNLSTIDGLLCIDRCRIHPTFLLNLVRRHSSAGGPSSRSASRTGREEGISNAPTRAHRPSCWLRNHSSHHWVAPQPRLLRPPTMRVHNAPRRLQRCRTVLDLPAQRSQNFLTDKMS